MSVSDFVPSSASDECVIWRIRLVGEERADLDDGTLLGRGGWFAEHFITRDGAQFVAGGDQKGLPDDLPRQEALPLKPGQMNCVCGKWAPQADQGLPVTGPGSTHQDDARAMCGAVRTLKARRCWSIDGLSRGYGESWLVCLRLEGVPIHLDSRPSNHKQGNTCQQERAERIAISSESWCLIEDSPGCRPRPASKDSLTVTEKG